MLMGGAGTGGVWRGAGVCGAGERGEAGVQDHRQAEHSVSGRGSQSEEGGGGNGGGVGPSQRCSAACCV
ncbi:unnamed protein product [Closterium sp. NIES-54]